MRVARLTGLFLFEFVVVLLGVLAAQAVAEWADERRLVRAAEVQFEQARDQAINMARIQHHWATVGPCMSDRARTVARAAANGETLPAAAIGRPSLPFRQMPSWDEDVRRAALKSIGPDRVDAISYFEGRATVMAETSGKVRDAWSTFTLLDPANGPPSAVDRSNVRLAAISVIDHIRLLGYANPAEPMAVLGVAEEEWKRTSVVGGQVDDCGMIRNWR